MISRWFGIEIELRHVPVPSLAQVRADDEDRRRVRVGSRDPTEGSLDARAELGHHDPDLPPVRDAGVAVRHAHRGAFRARLQGPDALRRGRLEDPVVGEVEDVLDPFPAKDVGDGHHGFHILGNPFHSAVGLEFPVAAVTMELTSTIIDETRTAHYGSELVS